MPKGLPCDAVRLNLQEEFPVDLQRTLMQGVYWGWWPYIVAHLPGQTWVHGRWGKRSHTCPWGRAEDSEKVRQANHHVRILLRLVEIAHSRGGKFAVIHSWNSHFWAIPEVSTEVDARRCIALCAFKEPELGSKMVQYGLWSNDQDFLETCGEKTCRCESGSHGRGCQEGGKRGGRKEPVLPVQLWAWVDGMIGLDPIWTTTLTSDDPHDEWLPRKRGIEESEDWWLALRSRKGAMLVHAICTYHRWNHHGGWAKSDAKEDWADEKRRNVALRRLESAWDFVMW